MSDETTWIEIEVKHFTESAILCEHGQGECWIPKSQIRDYSDEVVLGEIIEIEIPEWLAADKDMI